MTSIVFIILIIVAAALFLPKLADYAMIHVALTGARSAGFWTWFFRGLIGLALLAIAWAVNASAADVIIKVGDQPGATGFRDGDILHVLDAAEIARQWDEIDARGEAGQWPGADRTKAPLSDIMLAHFLVISVDESIAQAVKTLWLESEMSGETLIRKRKRFINWQARVPVQYRMQISDRDTVIDLRGVIAIPDTWQTWVEEHQ